jgi:hypothetical protein
VLNKSPADATLLVNSVEESAADIEAFIAEQASALSR